MGTSNMYTLVFLVLVVNIICFGVMYLRLKRILAKKTMGSIEKCVDYIAKIEKRMTRPFNEFQFTETNKTWAVITTINRIEYLERTINSIKQHEPDVSILVIDNGSTDGTCEYLMEQIKQNLIDKALFNRENSIPQWQKAFSMSQALKLISLEEVSYIAFLDDDIEITKPWIDDSIEILHELQDKDVKLVNLLTDKIQERVHSTLETVSVGNIQVKIAKTFNGAFFFVPAAIFREIGLPPIDEGLGDASAEDWYYSRRFQANNWSVAVVDYSIHLGYKTSVRTEL